MRQNCNKISRINVYIMLILFKLFVPPTQKHYLTKKIYKVNFVSTKYKS